MSNQKLGMIIFGAIIFVAAGWYLSKVHRQAPVVSNTDLGGFAKVYDNSLRDFSIHYPDTYSVDDKYQYQGFGPNKIIYGVKFTIEPSLTVGTNLSSDSYLGVEELPHSNVCDAGLFLNDPSVVAKNVTLDGTSYSVASTTGAGAGNRYEETVYALPNTNPCIAVRYLIHSSVFENYPPGAVKVFDSQKLHDQFDAIRKTLVVNQ